MQASEQENLTKEQKTAKWIAIEVKMTIMQRSGQENLTKEQKTESSVSSYWSEMTTMQASEQ